MIGLTFDLESYVNRVLDGPCRIGTIVAGDQGLPVSSSATTGTSPLCRTSVHPGYVLIAPIEFREAVGGDFALDESRTFVMTLCSGG